MNSFGLKRLADLIYHKVGLNYVTNTASLENKTKARLEFLKQSPADYCEYLQSNPSEWKTLIELITINETYFYREEHQLLQLKENILPFLKQHVKHRPIRIWSAACSTGEEPYTLGMIVKETGLFSDGEVEIVATDINQKVLDKAMSGMYFKNSLSFRRIPGSYLSQYFQEKQDHYEVDPSIKKMISFQNVNLLDPKIIGTLGQFDVIFCRNVLIYFDMDTIKKVIDTFYQRLRPDTYLFLGHAEMLPSQSHGLKLVNAANAFYYRKENVDETLRSIGGR
ncbi:protein-glutamate O-methyltransferase CheR [Bacillus sp. BGMRC 2118]|nr:protein-glutamate O-methyltransferase CheR [Bacillus sp. BGMRC 2118]